MDGADHTIRRPVGRVEPARRTCLRGQRALGPLHGEGRQPRSQSLTKAARRSRVSGFSGLLTLARSVCAPFAGDMLVYDFIHIPLPVAEVRHRLLHSVPELWQQAAAHAYDEGEVLLSRVGPLGPLPGLSKAVSVHLGNARVRGEVFVVTLQWSATGPSELFPAMEADLEIAPLGAQQSELRFSGGYDPPLGSLGRQLDRLLLHQLAEATVRAFLHRLVADLLVEPAPT